MQDVAIQVTAGSVAGWSLVTTGMPLDLLKTILQLNTSLSGQQMKQLIHKQGGFFKTFYGGASSLYLFNGLATALEFTVFETFQ